MVPDAGPDQARDLAETIVDTSESIHFFRRTPAASQVPSKLGEITTPTCYLWSQAGDVPARIGRPDAGVHARGNGRSRGRRMEGPSRHPEVVAATVAGFLQ